MPGTRKPDLVIIGGGACGMLAAAEATARGMGVVVLEAGPWLHPQQDFTGDEWDMLNPFDGLLRWGPMDRRKPAWKRLLDGPALIAQTAAVGGSGLASWGASPRALVASIQRGWPLAYQDLVPWYERLEEALPVSVPSELAPKDELFIEGCQRIGLDHLIGPDVEKIGWRLQSLSISPPASSAPAGSMFPELDGCTNCGGCLAGCRGPENAPLEKTAMRTAAAAFAPGAYGTGLMDLRTGVFVTELLHEERKDGRLLVKAVRYRDSEGRVIEQDGERFLLAAGPIENPRLCLASGLPSGDLVGTGFTCHAPDLVTGITQEEVDPALGPMSMARCDFPGFGSISSVGLSPMMTALATGPGKPLSHSEGPWSSSGWMAGSGIKRRLERWQNTLTAFISVDDTAEAGNAVSLAGEQDEHGAIPSVRYRPSEETRRRRDWLARRASEILIAAGADPKSVHRADLSTVVMHPMGTMRMGADESSSVVDPDGRLWAVANLYCSDTSVFPDAIGGADPTLTAQANTSRILHGLSG